MFWKINQSSSSSLYQITQYTICSTTSLLKKILLCLQYFCSNLFVLLLPWCASLRCSLLFIYLSYLQGHILSKWCSKPHQLKTGPVIQRQLLGRLCVRNVHFSGHPWPSLASGSTRWPRRGTRWWSWRRGGCTPAGQERKTERKNKKSTHGSGFITTHLLLKLKTKLPFLQILGKCIQFEKKNNYTQKGDSWKVKWNPTIRQLWLVS